MEHNENTVHSFTTVHLIGLRYTIQILIEREKTKGEREVSIWKQDYVENHNGLWKLFENFKFKRLVENTKIIWKFES